jgi:hypothetical protein
MRTLATVTLGLLVSPLIAQCDPLSLSWSPGTAAPFETATLHATAPGGTFAIVGFDESNGPTFIPGIGDVLLGFTSSFATLPVLMPASGQFDFPVLIPCKHVDAFYTQALTFGPSGLCLSNGARVQVQWFGTCLPLACVASSSIASNFNGTAIAQNNWVWFNAVVHVGQVPAAGATVGFRNSQIEITNGSTHYVLAAPNALITFDPGATSSSTAYDPIRDQWTTTVPASYTGDVFLSGLAFQLPAPLAGGSNPVTWSGEFDSLQAGLDFQWKWGAAVYTSFSGDNNALCVKPISSNVANPFLNSDHAGTPECFKTFVTGGARGGGGSNFTGSYSGTGHAACN